jgi:hypothetical protein
VSELGISIGPKAAKNYRYKERYAEARTKALNLLSSGAPNKIEILEEK